MFPVTAWMTTDVRAKTCNYNPWLVRGEKNPSQQFINQFLHFCYGIKLSLQSSVNFANNNFSFVNKNRLMRMMSSITACSKLNCKTHSKSSSKNQRKMSPHLYKDCWIWGPFTHVYAFKKERLQLGVQSKNEKTFRIKKASGGAAITPRSISDQQNLVQTLVAFIKSVLYSTPSFLYQA